MTDRPRTYMDNAATSFPKPPAVHQAMADYARQLGASPGRGAYFESRESGRLLDACRQRINQLIGGADASHVVFTGNCTDSLNLAIKGVVRPGDHLITTALDHNSILRPFNKLVADGLATQTRVPVDPKTGLVDPADIARAIGPDTRLIALLHGSNVTGTLQPIESIGRIAREHDVLFLVDAAQSLGHVPMNVRQLNIDLLAAPGHKGLLGPLGTGVLYIRPGLADQMTTIREGGTGSVSEQDTQPTFMPDKFEAGSHNTIGIIGLSEGVRYVLERGVESIWEHERGLIATMIESLTEWGEMPGFTMYGPATVKDRCGVFSVRIERCDDPKDLADLLESRYGILTRPGLHCAPGAHQTIGSARFGGTTRFSFGPFLTLQDVKYAADALGEICHQRVGRAVGAG
jgi:cysteine desulfurase family protein